MNIGNLTSATEILGDKWTPQLIRCIANDGTLRFCQIQDAVGGINPRTLSAKLSFLESQRIIEKNRKSENSRCEYILTKKGSDLLPILEQMHSWSYKYPTQIELDQVA